MYCIGCGLENVEGTARCIRCGQDLASLRTDQYSKPAPGLSSPLLWNPDVAAMLSVVFTPAFGAIVHGLNWQRLGQPRRARISWLWALGFVVVFLVGGIYAGAAGVSPAAVEAYARLGQLLALVLWYFSAARAQGKYVATQLRNEYFREGWFVPVGVALIAVGCLYGVKTLLR